MSFDDEKTPLPAPAHIVPIVTMGLLLFGAHALAGADEWLLREDVGIGYFMLVSTAIAGLLLVVA